LVQKKSRTCFVAGAVQHARHNTLRLARRACHDKRDWRDTQLSLLCNMYKVMITAIRFSKRITVLVTFSVSYSLIYRYIFIQFISFDVNKQKLRV